ncbi:hypothetical protein BCL57_000976 [Agromyces flavus]|uniref:Uncharacterized protein n=1 Tax=Agromyces flavus TaxID=589382 RepID=A0A1H1YWS2_9MICO|nr:hypothetical protein [Agromyces flavus]SDT25779.1 hypothetical protein SAMN04489721_2912 [Agromyces flavus]
MLDFDVSRPAARYPDGRSEARASGPFHVKQVRAHDRPRPTPAFRAHSRRIVSRETSSRRRGHLGQGYVVVGVGHAERSWTIRSHRTIHRPRPPRANRIVNELAHVRAPGRDRNATIARELAALGRHHDLAGLGTGRLAALGAAPRRCADQYRTQGVSGKLRADERLRCSRATDTAAVRRIRRCGSGRTMSQEVSSLAKYSSPFHVKHAKTRSGDHAGHLPWRQPLVLPTCRSTRRRRPTQNSARTQVVRATPNRRHMRKLASSHGAVVAEDWRHDGDGRT